MAAEAHAPDFAYPKETGCILVLLSRDNETSQPCAATSIAALKETLGRSSIPPARKIICPAQRPRAATRRRLPTTGRRAEAPPLRALPPARPCHGGRPRLCESTVAAARSLRRLSSPRPSVSPLRGLPQAAGSASRLRSRAACCTSTFWARPAPASRPRSGSSALRSGASALALSGSPAPSRVVPGPLARAYRQRHPPGHRLPQTLPQHPRGQPS